MKRLVAKTTKNFLTYEIAKEDSFQIRLILAGYANFNQQVMSYLITFMLTIHESKL